MAPSIRKSVLFGTGCLALPATRLISSSMAAYIVGTFGYYFVAGIFLLWAWLLYRHLRDTPLRWPQPKRALLIAAIIGAATYFSLCLEPAAFKVVMDEPLLASTAQSMHHSRMALVAGRGVDVHGYYDLLDGFVDKRPLLFPFLVSVLHDLTGYRVQNAFVLNALLTPLFWLLLWSIGRSIRSKDSDGFLAVALLSTAPLASNLANSGGFDWLNGCLLVFLVWVAQRLNREPGSRTLQGLLIATLALLANTRYEGLLWALPFGAFLLWRTGGLKSVFKLSWVSAISPWMVLMTFVHRMVDHAATWQPGPDGRVDRFSPDYVFGNIRSALSYFLGMDTITTASTLLFIVGLAGMVGIVFASLRALQKRTAEGRKELLEMNAAWLTFGVGSALHTVLLMYFNWGYFGEYTVSRLSFPLQISLSLLGTFGLIRAPRQTFISLILFSLGFVAYQQIDWDVSEFLETGLTRLIFTVGAILGLLFWILRKPDQLVQGVGLITIAFMALWTAPHIARHPYIGTHYPDRVKFEMIHSFVQAHKDERFLFISGIPYLSILEEIPTVKPGPFSSQIELARERILNQHAYSSVYYFQVFAYNRESKQWRSTYSRLNHPDIELELLETVYLGIEKEGKIYRVILKPAEPQPGDETH